MDADENLLRALVLSPELCRHVRPYNNAGLAKSSLFVHFYNDQSMFTKPPTAVDIAEALLSLSDDHCQRLGRQVLNILRSSGQAVPDEAAE